MTWIAAYEYAVAFTFGALVGSFLNVVIYRLPAGESIVRPRSRCGSCRAPIPWYHNIPLLSYILLRGRCQACGERYSARYLLVELLAALAAAGLYARYGLTFAALVSFAYVAAFIAISFIDLDHRIIPDAISLPGSLAGLVAATLAYYIPPPWRGDYPASPLDSLLGLIVGGGGLFAVAWAYLAATGRDGMGMGDVKLLAMIGAFLGWKGALLTLFLASVVGTLTAIPLVLWRGADRHFAVPFGPFLVVGAILSLLFGEHIIDAYMAFTFGVAEALVR